ncbi:cytochrome P450 [Actinomadura logoneensis]|uniref:Cytochrome P450 n=1 Tax=Actinomadura logoneensis TaxID=2293572 RepID=A0A372JB80_9ACTN|nr:cytochrome P450 [Actinomadura logoneensis]RFU37267.1 cytochrome P450 [Actinomadura logoneensis]
MSEPRAFPFPSDALQLSAQLDEVRGARAPVRVRLPYGAPAWLVTRYEDARYVLSSPSFARDPRRAGIAEDDIARVTPVDITVQTMVSTDPPDHTRVRRFVYRAFTPRRIERLRPGTERIADRLVDAMVEQGPPADLFEAFGLALPVQVICDLLGVPAADRDRFTAWTGTLIDTGGLPPEEVMAGIAEMNAYLAEQADLRARNPTDDLVGALVRARDAGDGLSRDELVNLVRTLLAAGHETTASQIPNFVFLLLGTGDYRRLHDRPELVPSAVEELLRYVPLITQGSFPRFVLEDTEVGGMKLGRGDQVLVELSAANRDGSVFPDPDVLDVGRAANPHVAFGFGLHRCVGAALARMELQVALATLTRRLPGLRLAVPADEVPWCADRIVRRPRGLPVTW